MGRGCVAYVRGSVGSGAWGDGMVGGEGGYRFRRREAMVDLPLPEEPTIAVQVPGAKVMETLLRTWTVGRLGYAKHTSFSLMGSGVGMRSLPWDSWDASAERLARWRRWVAVTRDWLICGMKPMMEFALPMPKRRRLMTVKTLVTDIVFLDVRSAL